jgi:hypothetical protein
MKKLLLSVFTVVGAFCSHAQVVCAGVSPAPITGNYEFTWGSPGQGWGTPNFLIPGNSITGELVLVDDGTAGTSSLSGLPNGNYGCAASPANAYAGKIAVVYRYDGTGTSSPTYCGFSDKALNALNSGAIGVIIVNREPGVVPMGAGTAGANVTVPVVMLSDSDGAALRAEMQNGPVTMFIGNKTGLYNDDCGITKGATLISKSYGVVSQLSQNASEFNFEIGSRVYNYGIDDQSNLTLTATVTNPSAAVVYDETVGPFSVVAGDSVDIIPGGALNFPAFSLATYPAGRYTVTYTLDLGVTDEYVADNSVTSDFVVNDSIFAMGTLDEITGLPVANNGYRPSTNTNTFGECIVLRDANASRIGVAGIYFSAQGTAVDLTGEEMALNLYKWDDAFVDLSDAALVTFDLLNPVAFGYYYYPSDLQGETVFGQFNTSVALLDNQRYLACVQTVNLEIYLGFDTKTNYVWNEAYYLQPVTPIENDGAYFASGFGADVVPAMGLMVFDAAEAGLNKETSIEGLAYPNPAVDVVTVSVNAEGNATLNVTDLAGRTVLSQNVTLENGKTSVNIASLNTGSYLFNVTLENGNSTQFSVVKK